jgi:hypothetical protein
VIDHTHEINDGPCSDCDAPEPPDDRIARLERELAEAQQWIDSDPEWKARFMAEYNALLADRMDQDHEWAQWFEKWKATADTLSSVAERAVKAERDRDEAVMARHIAETSRGIAITERESCERLARALTQAADALAAKGRELRGDANRLADRNLGGTYEVDVRQSISEWDAALATWEEIKEKP